MSLVGPRPPVPSEVEKYTLEDRKRLDVIPGLTCLWQIRGRSEIPFKEQVRLDKEYILAPSVWKDIVILLKTMGIPVDEIDYNFPKGDFYPTENPFA